MKAYLILADGTVWEGSSIGAVGETIGEAVFTTAMVGYMETLTDPSYYGQIVAHTFPLIGNYGTIEADRESEKPALKGYIVRELMRRGSNFRRECDLNEYLAKNGIVGIEGIDVRELTRKLREHGVMNAMITTAPPPSNPENLLKRIRAYKIKNAVAETTVAQPTTQGKGKYKVVLWDFGAKGNIERELIKRDCTVVSVPAGSTAEQILGFQPDGIMLSNGGGDPADNTEIIAELKKLNERKIPTFGICLGHQLLALASGARTKKLKYGHRGANQPVTDLIERRTYITSQNHGYAVLPKSLPETAQLRYTNANDKTCEGIDYIDKPAFSVQFHPESHGGPRDTEFLFDRFIQMMQKR